ncbi:hypothetical protein PBOI14_04680 [Pseudomonas sp. Boi14]|nr:hypothetical protein PBOI14_04680 [Pseudomonas sp. Boi14]
MISRCSLLLRSLQAPLLTLLCLLPLATQAAEPTAVAPKAYLSLIIDDLGQNLPGTAGYWPCPAR